MTSRPLTIEEQSALEAGFAFAARIASAVRPLSLEDVQNLYDGFLNEGVDDADAMIGSSIYVHPISMLQKRLGRRETINIEQLCNDTLAQIGPSAASGNFAPR